MNDYNRQDELEETVGRYREVKRKLKKEIKQLKEDKKNYLFSDYSNQIALNSRIKGLKRAKKLLDKIEA